MHTPFDITADLDTPVSAFLKLQPFGPRFLLESAEGGERLGRYSFIGFGDALTLRIDGARTRLGDEARPAPTERGPLLDLLREALERAPRPGPELPGVPFVGGLVGVTGYDVVRSFERLAPAREGAFGAAYVATRSTLVFDHLTRRAAVLHDGPDAERVALRREVIAAMRGSLPAPSNNVVSEPEGSLSPEAFTSGVERAKREIAAGEVYQLVLSVAFAGHCDLSPFEVYRAVRLLNPSPYLFFFDLDDLAVVGSSPEALVRLDGRRASLRPIAGTRPRAAGDPEADAALERELLADPKEAAEHVMLVDLARNDLGRVAVTGSVRVDPYRAVERYSHVMHLVSGVEGVLEPGADAFDLFAASFPAGTVVGAPKIRAMQLIDEMEPVSRGVYAGTAGYFGHGGTMDQAIAIRTLAFTEDRYVYQAGAGIVADSDPRREYEEVLAKSEVMRHALALAGEGL